MYLMIRLDYRTAEGAYCTAYRSLHHEEALQALHHVGRWVLENLPEGASLIQVSQGWSPVASHELVIDRIRKMAIAPTTKLFGQSEDPARS
jgi:hypothetical protein